MSYNPCPEGYGGGVILKYKFCEAFNYVEQNGYLKICIGCAWGSGGRGRGVSCPSITFNYKKFTSPFNF